MRCAEGVWYVMVVSGRAIRMTSEALCTSVWNRDLAAPGVKGLGQLLTVERQAHLSRQGLEGVGEVDGQLVGSSRRR